MWYEQPHEDRHNASLEQALCRIRGPNNGSPTPDIGPVVDLVGGSTNNPEQFCLGEMQHRVRQMHWQGWYRQVRIWFSHNFGKGSAPLPSCCIDPWAYGARERDPQP